MTMLHACPEALHEHYPTNELDGLQLYGDFINVMGLTHYEALRALGYSFGYDITTCPYVANDTWKPSSDDLMLAIPGHAFGAPDIDARFYRDGAEEGVNQASFDMERGIYV